MSPEEILAQIEEMQPDEEILEFTDLRKALIGWSMPWMTDGTRPLRLVYSAHRCVEVLMEDGMTEEEACEWLSVNTEGAYVGPNTPIVMYGEEW